MASLVRYFFRKLGANFVDFSLDYPDNGYTLNGTDVVFLGSTGVDRVYLQKGIKFNFSNSGAGTDEVYLDGNFADFTLSAKGSSTLVLTSAARANTQITLAQEDKVVFNNGSIAVADLISYAIDRSANAATAAPSLNAAENALSLPSTRNADGTSNLSSILRAYTKDVNGAVFAQPSAGVTFIVTGHNGVDKVYVAKGGQVNANNLGGGIDLIYLTGFKSEYSASASGSSVLLLSKGTEKVTLASGDKIIFADGSTLVSAAITAAASPAAWTALTLDGSSVTPGLAPVLSIKSGQDAYLDYLEAGSGLDVEINYGKLALGDTYQFRVAGVLSAAYSVTATDVSSHTISYYLSFHVFPTLLSGNKTLSILLSRNGTRLEESNTLNLVGDIRPLRPPVITLGAGVSDGASQAEALAASGVVSVQGDAGSSVKITFTDSAARSLVKTLSATGAAQPVSLSSNELSSLQDGSISVSANEQYAPLVSGFNTRSSTSSSASFTLDKNAPAQGNSFATVVGNLLTLNYNNPLDEINQPAPAFFQVKSTPSGGSASRVAVNAARVKGNSVELTLASNMASGAAVTVSFVDPSDGDDANTIQDLAGNDAPSFYNQTASNNPPAAPSISTVLFSDTVGDTTAGKASTALSAVISFNEPVTVTGTVTFNFRVGSSGATFSATAAATTVASKTITLSATLPAATTAADNGNITLTGITLGTGASITGAGSGQTYSASQLTSSPVTGPGYSVDNSAPSAPTLTLGNGVSGGATTAEASASTGVIRVVAEAGTNVVVSFSDGDATHTLVKTVQGNGATPVPVPLTLADIVPITKGKVTWTYGFSFTATFNQGPNSPTVVVSNGINTVWASTGGLEGLKAFARANATANASTVFTLSGPFDSTPLNYTATATATDAAGNSSPAGTASFTLDPAATAPTITLGTGVSGGATVAEATASSGVITVTAESGNAVLLTLSDSASPAHSRVRTLTGTGSAQTVTLASSDLTGANGLQDGAISISASATDAAGNLSSVASSSFSLDRVAPARAPNASTPVASVVGNQLTINFSETLDADSTHKPALAAFTVQKFSSGGSGTPVTFHSLVVSGSQVILSLSQSINDGETAAVSYVDPSASDDTQAIQDAAGNDLPSFASQAVSNNTAPKVTSLVITDAVGDTRVGKAGSVVSLVLGFSEPVTLTGTPVFRFRIGGVGGATFDVTANANASASSTLTLSATLPTTLLVAENNSITLTGVTLGAGGNITGSLSAATLVAASLGSNPVSAPSYNVDTSAPATPTLTLFNGPGSVATLAQATASSGVLTVTGELGAKLLVTFADSANAATTVVKTLTGNGATQVPVVLSSSDVYALEKSYTQTTVTFSAIASGVNTLFTLTQSLGESDWRFTSNNPNLILNNRFTPTWQGLYADLRTSYATASTVFTTNIPASIPAASFTITASATDAAGNSSRVAVSGLGLDISAGTPAFAYADPANVSTDPDYLSLINLAEMITGSAGAPTLAAELGSRVLITYTDSAAHSVVKTDTGRGSASGLLLSATDLGTGIQQLQDGSISVTATATDLVGNVSSTASGSFTLDTVAPKLTPHADGTPALSVLGTTLTLNFDEALDDKSRASASSHLDPYIFQVYYTPLGGSPVNVPVSSALVYGKQLRLGLQSAIPAGAAVTLRYTHSNPTIDLFGRTVIQDPAGNDVPSFSQTVTNLASYPPTPIKVSFSDANGNAYTGKPGAQVTALVSWTEQKTQSGTVIFTYQVGNGPAFTGTFTVSGSSTNPLITLPEGAGDGYIKLTGVFLESGSTLTGDASGQSLRPGYLSTPLTDTGYWVDSTPPTAPVLNLAAGIADGATRAEATASTGVLTVSAESGSTVLLSFTDSQNHSVHKTLTATGSAQAVTLAAADFGNGTAQLSDGSIRVSASATDLAGNSSSASSSGLVLNDSVAPAAPWLTLGSGVGNSASRSEATSSDLIKVQAESGSTVYLTFTDSSTPTAHSIIKTISARGLPLASAVAVSLSAADLGAGTAQLADGSIRVSASATDASGNLSANSSASSFVLDSVAPVLLSAQVVGDLLTLRYDSPLASEATRLPLATAFTVSVNGSTNAVTALASPASNMLQLTLTSLVAPGATVYLSYAPPAASAANGPVQDLAGNSAAMLNFGNVSVSNSTPLRPVITSVVLSDGDSGAASKYGKQGGAGLTATVTFSEEVNVFGGAATLTFGNPNGAGSFTGTIAADANASTFSRTKTVAFTGSTLPAGDFAVSLKSVSLASGASISAKTLANSGSGGVLDANNFSVGGALGTGYTVDNTAPAAIERAGRVFAVDASNAVIDAGVRDTLKVGDKLVLEMLWTEPVTITGSVTSDGLFVGETVADLKLATYDASFPGTTASKFYLTYSIASGDLDNDGITFVETSPIGVNPVGGTFALFDLAGKAPNGSLGPVTRSQPDIPWLKVDAVAPTIIGNVLILTGPSNGRTAYAVGDKVLVAVSFSEKVLITGSPQIPLTIGSTVRNAVYDSSNPLNTDTLKYFSYTIAAGETDTDGITIAANALSLNSGSITDVVGNAATLTSSAVPAVQSTSVDTTTPTAPTLALGSGVGDGATRAEATASTGVVTVNGEAGSKVLLTFSGFDSNNIRHSLTKTLAGTGAAQAVTLSAFDLGANGEASNQLPDGSINVSAVVQDAAGNTSPAAATSFTLNARLPRLTLALGNGVSDGATQAEAIASSGVVKLNGQSGNTVLLTFSDSSSPAHTLVRTITSTGTEQAVTLASSELGSGSTQLAEGIIYVTASTSSASGTSNSAATQFVLDTVVPKGVELRTGLVTISGFTQFGDAAAANVSGDLTLEAWVFLAGPQILGSSFLSIKNSSAAAISLSTYQGKLTFTYSSGVFTGESVAATTNLATNVWTHVAATVGTGSTPTVTLYENGVAVQTGTLSAAIPTIASPRSVTISQTITGAIRDVRIYDDLRSATEIASDKDGTVDITDTNLKNYYPFSASPTASGLPGGAAASGNNPPLLLGNPALSFSADTGTAGDFITSTHNQTITYYLANNLAANDVLWGSLNNGGTWTDLTAMVNGNTLTWANARLLQGSNTLKFKLTDKAGNQGTEVFSQTYQTGLLTGPSLTLGTGVADGANRAEAIASSGVLTVTANAGSRVVVTFTDELNHSLSKTVFPSGGGSLPIVLASSDIGTGASQLYNGLISVTAQATPADNSVGSELSSTRFTLYANPLSLGSGIADGASTLEAVNSGVVSVYAPSGSRVLLTFSDSATPAHQVVKTVGGLGSQGATQPVKLGPGEIGVGAGKLQDGSINVRAVTYDPTGNIHSSGSISFTLDTTIAAPVISLPAGGTVINPVGSSSLDLTVTNTLLHTERHSDGTYSLYLASSLTPDNRIQLGSHDSYSTLIAVISNYFGQGWRTLTLANGTTFGAAFDALPPPGSPATISAEAGSTVAVTWTDSSSHQIIRTVTGLGAGTAVPIPLDGSDIGTDFNQLGQGVIRLSATATNIVGKTSSAGSSSFTLDTLPPTAYVTREKGLKLDSSKGQYVQLPAAAAAVSGDLTLEAWVYVPAAQSNWVSILDLASATGSQSDNLELGIFNSKLALRASNGTTTLGAAVANTTFTTNAWHHVAATVGGASNTTVSLYVDGSAVSVTSPTLSAAILSATRSSSLVGRSNFGHTAFSGTIRDVRIYDNARTAAEIAADKGLDSTPGSGTVDTADSNLKGYYPFSSSATASGKTGGTAAVTKYTSTDAYPFPTIGNPALRFSADTGIPNDFITSTQTQTITATLTEPLGAGDTLWGRLDSASTWTDLNASVSGSTLTWSNATLLSGSGRQLQLKTVDTAGNASTVLTQDYSYVNDTVAPTATIDTQFGLTLNATYAQFADLPAAAVAISADITLEAWVFANGTQRDWARIFDFNDAAGLTNNIILGITGGKLGFSSYRSGGGKGEVIADTAFPLNSWHHVAVTVGGNSAVGVTLFIDGVAVKTGTLSAQITSITRENAFVGHSNIANDTADFNGTIRDIRIYDATRTAADIAADMVSATAATTNLVGYYQFTDDNKSDLAVNNGLDATINFTTNPPILSTPNLSFSNDQDLLGPYAVPAANAVQTITARFKSAPAAGEKVWGSLDDGGTWTDLSGSTVGSVVTWTGATLLSGTHTLELQVRDSAGNCGPLISQTYLVI